jgi:MFS family permease
MTQTSTFANNLLPVRAPVDSWHLQSGRLRPLGLLADRNFLLFWVGQSVSKVGNGIYQVGLAWSVYQLTGSTVAMGAVLAANAIPQLVLLLVGGTVADRLSRRSIILAADGAACLVTLSLALAAAMHSLSVPLLAIGAIALGIVSAFFGPAYSAMNKDLVQKNKFRAANAMLTVSSNGARVLGPAAAGLIYALGGAGLVFVFDAATFGIAVATMIFTQPARRAMATSDHTLCHQIAAGLDYTVRTRWLALILAVSMIANFACLAPYFVLLPELVRSHHDGVGLLGMLTTAQVLACIVGAAVIGRFMTGLPAGRSLLLLASAIGAGALGLGLGASVQVVLFLSVALIGLGLSFDVIENTLLQSLIPADLLSRVYSVNMVVSFALLPVGYIVAGWLAHVFGTASVFTAGGAVLIVACCCSGILPAGRHLNNVRC